MLNVNPFSVEHVTPGVMKEISANGKLVIFTLDNGSTETIYGWVRAAQATLLAWHDQPTCFILHDFHRCGEAAVQARIHENYQELSKVRPDLPRYVAVVAPQGSSLTDTRLLIKVNELKAPSRYPIHWEVFAKRRDALKWLLSKIA